jgi:glyoxylase-like metal-dependent hydrolase (beta-lactamase superfamily II)/8-oxo-dGTP pyrophosphatase MutT (NUDIX family)
VSAPFYTLPADARPAASLILLRDATHPSDGAPDIEVLMLRRAERDGDLRSGAAVFPGGVLDARDRAAHAHQVGGDDAALSARFRLPEGALDYALAAVRETFEEVGLLLLDGPVAEADAAPWRDRLQQGTCGAADIAQALGRRWDLRGLHCWSHWLSPPGVHKRFDTRFFIAAAPADQSAVADGGEALELMWLRPEQALSPAQGLKLLPVTRRTLQQLARHRSVAAALAEAQAPRDIPLVMPRAGVNARGQRTIVLPDEFAYAELAHVDPLGRCDHPTDLVPGRAVRLSPQVIRVTAPNPGMMTGPGTNSYLVGGGEGESASWAVIDPGPVDDGHLQALLAAAPGRISHVLATHTHLDHSPGAADLAAATGAQVWGRRPDHAAGQDPHFQPSYEPADGDTLALGGGVVLRVLHTPGHASNHLCFLLEGARWLFTGDHVMQGSTVVINPPDGDMVVYLQALERLLGEDLELLAPGHGFLVAQPHAVVRGLIAHRLKREAKVLQALGPQPADLGELVARVYDDVPAALHPVARRSLLAHLLKLQHDGAARAEGAAWARM